MKMWCAVSGYRTVLPVEKLGLHHSSFHFKNAKIDDMMRCIEPWMLE